MKIRHLAACVIAAAIVAVPASGAPGRGMQVARFFTYFDDARGFVWGDSLLLWFFAQRSDDIYSGPYGYVEADAYDLNTGVWSAIVCGGPAYANALSVSPTNGDTSVNATLDPASPDCWDLYGNITSPITMALSGRADGSYHDSRHGNGSTQSGTEKYRYNTTHEQFGEIFDGSNGFAFATFSGASVTERNIQLQQVK